MTQSHQQQGVGSPISNAAYNVLSALHSKLEGLEAYRKYAQDGDEQLGQQLSGQDNQAVETLVQELERLVREGRFRMGPPGGEGGATMDAPRMDTARPSRLLAVLPPTPRPEPIPPDPTSLPPTPHPILTPDRPVP